MTQRHFCPAAKSLFLLLLVLGVATLLLDAAHDDADALVPIAANILSGPAIVP
jgi:hypothetical protein